MNINIKDKDLRNQYTRYKDAKHKAKQARIESLKLLANAKKIRNIYMLDDLESESSDNEDFETISNSGSEISEY